MAQMFADKPVDEARDPQTYAIIGAAMAVHSELGCGFLERVYQEALAMEFTERGIAYQKELTIPVAYRGKPLDAVYRADFVCHESVIVEVKAVSELADSHSSQALNYLKATGLQRAIVLNFGESRLKYRRVVLNYH